MTDEPSAPENTDAPSSPAPPRRTLSSLKTLVSGRPAPAPSEPGDSPVREAQRDSKGRAYATGRRKASVARVWIMPGHGRIQVNGRPSEVYFARPVLQMIVCQPLVASQRRTELDIHCTVKGGGLSGQAGAVRHGISRGLISYEPGLRPLLKGGGFLTRDARTVERKKYGRRKARRSFQFSKR